MPLAHFNWATLKAAPDDPAVADFFAGVDQVNAIAERSPGFVWRHGTEDEAARAIGWRLFFNWPPTVASFSVWESEEAFRHFVHNTLHGKFLARGHAWFQAGGTYNYVLWPVAAGHIPTIKEARDRVEMLERDGPTPAAYTL